MKSHTLQRTVETVATMVAVVKMVAVAVAIKSRQHAGSAGQRATRQRIALTVLALAADCGKRRVKISVCMSTRHRKRVRPTAVVARECRGCLTSQRGQNQLVLLMDGSHQAQMPQL